MLNLRIPTLDNCLIFDVNIVGKHVTKTILMVGMKFFEMAHRQQ